MKTASGSIALIHSALPHYRERMLRLLRERLGDDLSIHAGDEHFRGAFRTSPTNRDLARALHNRYLLGGRLLWQAGSLGPALRAEVTVIELNPRILNSWVTALVRRVRGRPTIAWGHAFPRSGPTARTDLIRRLLRWLPDGLILYTEHEREELRRRGFRHPVWVAPNALYFASELGATSGKMQDVVYVGRLDADKRPDLALRGFALAASDLPDGTQLHVVGRGAMEAELIDLANDLGIADRVVFHGEVTDVDALRDRYGDALVSVIPGFVGLSATQSLGFGVHVIYALQARHAPEVATLDQSNSRVFDPPSPESLARALIDAFAEAPQLIAARAAVASASSQTYSIERMADGFVEAITAVRRSRPSRKAKP